MWNFEPCQVDSGMQLLDDMLIHFVSFCFSLQQFLFILVGCCKPMVRLTCWLQTARHVSLGHYPWLAKPGARAALERSSNFSTTTKTSTLLVFFAAVKPTISFLKVSEIETEARPSPGTN